MPYNKAMTPEHYAKLRQLRSTESVYKKLQKSIMLKKGESYRKISIEEYCNKYPIVTAPLLESFTEIHGFENGVSFRFKRKLRPNLYNYQLFTDMPLVFWIEDGYIHKKKMFIDEVVKIGGTADEYFLLVNTFSEFTNSEIILAMKAYSEEFIITHANRSKMKRAPEGRAGVMALFRRIKINDILANK
jgi:hypothetical protein